MEDTNELSANGLMVNTGSHHSKSKEIKRAPQDYGKAGKRFSKEEHDGRKSIGGTQGSGFVKADFEKALEKMEKNSNRFYKGKELGIFTDSSAFKMYGPGISLFFQFQIGLIKTFLIMAVISLTPVIYNYLTGPVMASKGQSLAYSMASTSIGNFSSTDSSYKVMDKYINVISDMVVILCFIIFYFYWLKKGTKLTEQIRTRIKLRSYNVLELVDFPQNATIQDIQKMMSQFGTVVEVAPVRNYKETISLSKKIFDLEVDIKKLEFKKAEQNTGLYNLEIRQTKQKVGQLYKELVTYEDETHDEVIMYYVTFSDISQKIAATNILKQHEKRLIDCCGEDTPDNYKLCGSRVEVKPCHTEPGEIIWENQHITWKTRWMRVVFQNLLLIVALVGGFMLISFLNILTPSASSSVDTSAYSSTTIQAETNTTIVQSWCIANQVSVIQSGSSTVIYTFCWDYIYQALLKTAITIAIAIGVVIIKFVLKHFAIFLSQFRRYKTHAEQSKSMIFNLFFVYLSTTVLLILLLQANMLSISFKSLITYVVTNDYLVSNSSSMAEYSDFISDWYVSIGYQIIFNCIILVVHPALTMPIYYCLNEKISRCKAEGENVQAKMEKLLQPEEFQLESDYAEILTLIFMSLAFSGSMPIITVITFFALCLRYLFEKYYFFRYCRVPKAFDEALDLQATSLLPWAIIIHFTFSIWMFGTAQIFASDENIFNSMTDGSANSFVESIAFILERVFATWYYSALFLIFLLVWTFKQILYNFIAKTFMNSAKSSHVIGVKPTETKTSGSSGSFALNTNKSLCDSYKIENNPDYVQVLEIMKKKRKFIIKLQNMPQNFQ